MARAASLAIVLAALIGCATPQGSGSTPPLGAARGPAEPAARVRIIAAMSGDPPVLYQKLNTNNATRGIVAAEQLVDVGLTIHDDAQVLHPRLAEAVPSIENGLWRVFPDGRMETTWHIRPNARWHDGEPFTAGDLVFTATVGRDQELGAFGLIAYRSLDTVEATDPRTVTVRWSKPYIQADWMFSNAIALPLPRHLLERAYMEDKTNLMTHPYWNQQFVGTGPFKLQDWVVGSHLLLRANDDYVLGRPKIDEIEVRFILDSNAIMANVLAGAVDVTLDRTLSTEQAIQVRSSWDGEVMIGAPDSAMNLWPQLLTPNPSVIGNVQFRRALFYAIDRQQMVDVLMAGLSSVTDSWVGRYEPEYATIEPKIVKYRYDPRLATQMIEGLGYTMASDGLFRDATGQNLSVELRTISLDVNQKALFSTADFWKRAGVDAQPVVIPTERQSDQEYRSTFPGFDLNRGAARVTQLDWLHSSNARLPENNFRPQGSGINYARYTNPDLDQLIERLFTTIPRAQRMDLAGDIARVMTDQALVVTLFYDAVPVLSSRRLRGVAHGLPFNAEEWSVQ